MKTIGLIGGMSWESTVPYYREINEHVRLRRGGLHSARVALYSVDFADIEPLQRTDLWDEAGEALARAGRAVEAAGADFIVLCTNTMHKVAPAIEAAVSIPLLHIADPTAEAVKRAGIRTIGLLGTRFTMEQDFYRERLQRRHGLEVIVPAAQGRDVVHRVIYEELCRGVVTEESRAQYREVIAGLVRKGAGGVILGCTEIAMLVSASDSSVPVFDTTRLHAAAAVDFALAEA
ncbi:MAG: aspartate/glutamate racemase family protein [Holophagales bacterium]|nr:aspartate/glutamate racemase family protein [Holophagales bacterium]